MAKVATHGLTAGSAPFLLRDPTLSHTHVAFSYGGNIWTANRGGGELCRLTSAGREGRPVFSPDGKHIAFIGEYGGPRGVFVVPATGGEPRRLTYHPDDLGPANFAIKAGDEVGWTPDGKRIFFSSRRTAFAGGMTLVVQLFTVPLEGGYATRLPLERAAHGSFSPDAARIAYVPHVPTQPEWKRYRGGQTTPISIANLTDSSIEVTIPRDNSNDFNPMWVGDAIYFLSDRNGPVTLFSYDMKSQHVRQLVKNAGFDIKSASALPGMIVYEQLGSLHLLDVGSGRDRELDIRPTGDFPEVRPHFKNLADIVGSDVALPNVAPKLSPTGTRAILGIRGEILTIPTEKGDICNVTRTPGVVERDPAWSPDGKSIAYFSDESGEYALHIREQGALRRVRKIDLGQPPSLYYQPTWSPDGRKIAYTDKRLNYWYVDLEEGTPVCIDRGPRVDPARLPRDPACRLPMSWSPDGLWLAYTKMLENHLHGAFVYSIEQNQAFPLTDGLTDVLHVAFDKAGEYLYFTASTQVGLAGDWMAMSRLDRAVKRGVCALLLNRAVATPLALRGDENSLVTSPRKAKSERVEIDLEGVSRRIVHLPVPARNYSGLFAGGPGVLFLIEAPAEQAFSGRPQQVHRFDLATQRAERILEDVVYFDLSFGGDRLLYAKPQGTRRQWFTDTAQTSGDGSGKSNPRLLNFDSVEVYVDPRAEWDHLFEQVWRVQRDFFYDPGLHGLNLEETKKKYRPFLENIVTRNDLYYLFGEMLGNLTIGHLWALPLEDLRRVRGRTGLLGADYAVDRGRYRFARIYESDPWSPTVRSPLGEPGRTAAVGEYLLAVDGREVRPTAEVFSYFENTAGKRVVLTVGPEPDGTRSREVCVIPLDDEYPLRYFAWIEGNRRRVDELSGGRVAYVHLPDCAGAGYTAFNRHYFAQIGKEAAIIDARYNNGGDLPDYLIDCLTRTPVCYFHAPEGSDLAAPSLSIVGPKVMLINEISSSMGEILPWMFRRAGIGPSIGQRTWGGSVGHYAYASDLLDHGMLTDPNLAFYTPEGEWEIENQGVSPDIDVKEDPKAARNGRDVQLERAIEVVVQLLKSKPLSQRPRRPAFPRYRSGT